MLDKKTSEELSLGGAVGALLSDEGECGEGGGGDGAEAWATRLAERAARDDALNVGGMLAAAGAGGGAALARALEAGAGCGAALRARAARYEELLRGAPDAVLARSGAARLEANQRRLLAELRDLLERLDADLPDSEPDLGSATGRARALAAAQALRAALRGGAEAGALARLGAVRERLRRLGRARDRLGAALGRHLNNLLIHRGNEAAAAAAAAPAPVSGAPPAAPLAAPPGYLSQHHAELLQYVPFMRWLKEMDEKTYEALIKVYVSTWARVFEREVRAACETARAHLSAATTAAAGTAPPAPLSPLSPPDLALDNVLTLVETMCNAEQEFCTQFFCLDFDVKGEGSDGSRSEKSDDASSGGGAGGNAGARRGGGGGGGGGGDARRLLAELFPSLETELVGLVHFMDKNDPYGAMRALACLTRRVLGAGGGSGGGGGGGGGGGAETALAAAAVAAKRGADRCVAERVAGYAEAVRAAQRKPRAGLFSFLQEFEEITCACEAIFSRGRRADVERWYGALADGMLAAVAGASHPRTPRPLLQLENYHRLHALLAQLRVPAIDHLKREAKTRYQEALKEYVTSSLGQPLEKVQRFFEGVSAALAGGARESEVHFHPRYSKHELRRVLALYPPHEVRKSLHRLYRGVEKQLSPRGALLQVVWRAMQEQLLEQHRALESRIAACYPGAGLALPLSTQDILDAFSDIAREH